MAVYTPVGRVELERWLARFDVGWLVDFRGIAVGIENTNYFVTTSQGEFVLTLFERLLAPQLPYYLELMRHLAGRDVACATPVPNRDGALLDTLNGKPATLVTRLPGQSTIQPDAGQCRMAAAAMARMHIAGRDFGLYQPNPRGPDWWRATAIMVHPFIDSALSRLLDDELDFLNSPPSPRQSVLPSGPIHADLFRDNVLFDNGRLGGFVDFYFAGHDSWLYDVAVSVNDWCTQDGDGNLDVPRTQAFLAAYAGVRSFTTAERDAWTGMLRAAALRFWVSRLADLHLPRPAQLLAPHDPAHFERILRLRRTGAAPEAMGWVG